jgi:glycosyltransferase involved in cell wall biosynthesis
MTEFSLLIPVYGGDRADYLDQALTSAFEGQDLTPAQVVVVQDGPVGPDLAACLAAWEARPPVQVVRLARNGGIARALNVGLKYCRYRIVARLDADDVCLPGRFAAQVPLVAGGLDIVGGAIREFTDWVGDSDVVRHCPSDASGIVHFAHLHNPFAHPSVAFNANLVRQVGGYPLLDGFEDYLLWVKCLMAGARVANVERELVGYRVSAAAYRRRGGPRLVLGELRLQRTLRAIGFTSRLQFLRNVVLRVGFELAPAGLRQHPLRRALAANRTRRNHGTCPTPSGKY